MRGRRRRKKRGCGRALNSRMAVNSEQDMDPMSLESVLQSQPQSEWSGERYKWHARTMRRDEQKRVWEEGKEGRPTCGSWRPHKSSQAGGRPPKLSNGRLRNFRFSREENMVLISRLLPVYEQLLGKQKSTIPLFRRTQMWQEICNAVNRVGNRQRVVHHCKKRFSDIKRQLKNKLDREKCCVPNSGQVHVYLTQYEEELNKFLLAEAMDGIEVFDSDRPQNGSFSNDDAGSSYVKHPDQTLPVKENSLSEAEPVQTPLNLATLLDDQWNLLPDLCSTYTAEPSSPSNHPRESQPKLGSTDSPRRSEVTGVQDPPLTATTPSPFHNVRPTSKQLNIMKATQRLFRKGITHNLKVLRWDIHQLTKDISENHVIAKDMLRAKTQRNSILSQMNHTISEAAESIQLLANQQQAERILLDGFLGVPSSRKRRRGPSKSATTGTSALRSLHIAS